MLSRFNLVLMAILVAPIVLYALSPDFEVSIGSLNLTASRFLGIATLVMIYVVASVGLNVQTGFAGQLNLGYAGFMAIGAYAAAIFQVEYSEFVVAHEFLAVGICLLLSFAASALVGFLICLPTLRLRGDYFAIVTFGFAELVRQFIKNEEKLTGGSNGLPDLLFIPQTMKELKDVLSHVLSPEQLSHFDVHTYVKYLFFLLIIAVVVWFVTSLRDSGLGRTLFALRDNATAAESCGISLTYTKAYAFLVSSGIGGIAGYMLIVKSSIASPDDFQFMISVFVVCCVVLGGLGSVRGSVLGALVLMSLGELIRDVLEALPKKEDGLPLVPSEARIIFFGLVLVLMMRFRPNGLITLESDTRRLAQKDDESPLKASDSSSFYQIGKKS